MKNDKKPDVNWIKQGINKEAVLFAEKLGEELADKNNYRRDAMSTSQLRNFFGEVRRIESNVEKHEKAFYMLRPKLAYATARAKKHNKIHRFQEVIDYLLLEMKPQKDQFENFVKFLEAIVAYHKVNGGE